MSDYEICPSGTEQDDLNVGQSVSQGTQNQQINTQ